MTIPVQPTLTINVDGAVFEVAKMSADVQQLVRYFDEFRQREVDLTTDLVMVRGALRDMQNTLLQTIQVERLAAMQKTAEPTQLVEDAVPSTPTATKRARKGAAQ